MDLKRLSEDRIAAINFCEATLLACPSLEPESSVRIHHPLPVVLAVTHETAFYGSLNAALRSTDREEIKPFFPWSGHPKAMDSVAMNTYQNALLYFAVVFL